MFGSKTEPKCHYVPLKSLTDVCSGGTPDREKTEYWVDGQIPWVKTTELQNSIIYSTEECITEKGLLESSAKIVPSETILIAMYGQGKTRGMTAFLGIEACTNQACACILPTDRVRMKFLWHYFICQYEDLRNLAKGSNQTNLNAGMIKDYLVPLPSFEDQKRFEQLVEQSDKSKFDRSNRNLSRCLGTGLQHGPDIGLATCIMSSRAKGYMRKNLHQRGSLF